MKMVVSEKQIISIGEFMENYLGIKYTRDNKLTHVEMLMFLRDKGNDIPERVNFDKIKKEQLLTGDFLAVKDEASKILFYKNPINMKLKNLLSELKSQANLEQTRKARRYNLNEQGYQEAVNGVVKKEDLEEEEISLAKPNRQKQLIRADYYKKRHY